MVAAVRPRRPPDVWLWAAVVAGGALGTLLRLAAGELRPTGDGWPLATGAVNLVGAAFLAWVAVRTAERMAPTRLVRPLLGTGLCGGLTTFSGMQVEAVRLLRDDRPGPALAYLVVSVVGGLLVVGLVARAARGAR